MSDSYVERFGAGMTFVGPDATKLVQAVALRYAINLYIKTGLRPNRAYTPIAMAAAAGRITGKVYKPRKPSLFEASIDLKIWIETMKSALPVVDKGRD